MRRFLLATLAGFALLVPLRAVAQGDGRIEIVEVKGIIDGNVERSILTTIEDAGREGAELVVLQIDSRGTVGGDRVDAVLEAIATSSVPIATWIGPAAARGENGAAAIALAGHIRAIAPGATIGPIETLDLSRAGGAVLDGNPPQLPLNHRSTRLGPSVELMDRMSAADAVDSELAGIPDEPVVQHSVPALADLLDEVDGARVEVSGKEIRLSTDPDESSIRFHKGDLPGRGLHAAAQPSIVYLLLLLALVGIVFELFHPSTGPAGVSGLVALGLTIYGMVTLGGSWLGFALIVVGVALFALDLRFQSLSFPTLFGFAGLVVGSLFLFPGPYLRVSSWVLVFGIVSMTAFLIGAMTRVMRDLRAVARGELEVTDAHPHPDGHGESHAP
jgi:membrane-bound serine protease (ClpP class)